MYAGAALHLGRVPTTLLQHIATFWANSTPVPRNKHTSDSDDPHPSTLYHIEITLFEGQGWGGSCSSSSTAHRFVKCTLGVTNLAAIEHKYLLPILMKNKQQGDKNPPSRRSSCEAHLPRTTQPDTPGPRRSTTWLCSRPYLTTSSSGSLAGVPSRTSS